MNRYFLLTIFSLVWSFSIGSETVDQKCAEVCRNKGYQYHYCENKCQGNKSQIEKDRDTSHAPLENEMDIKCMNVCIKEKNSYNKCEAKCRF